MWGRLLGRLGTCGRFGKLKCRVNRDPPPLEEMNCFRLRIIVASDFDPFCLD